MRALRTTTRRLFAAALLTAALALGGSPWVAPAAAMDPRLPVLAGEASAPEKVARFERAHAQDAELIGALRALSPETPDRDRIHRALLANPAYAAAVAEYERGGDSVERWRELLAAPAAEDVYLRAHATYFLGRALLTRDDLQGAAGALEQVRGRLRVGTPWSDEATLYLGYVYARLPELTGSQEAAHRSRARVVLSRLLPEQGLYPEAPERVLEGARWLLRELRGDGTSPLLELARRMETIERMIRRVETGKGTQARQEQVVQSIDHLIELLREKEKG